MATVVSSRQFVPPSSTPDYTKQVLDPIKAAQAKALDNCNAQGGTLSGYTCIVPIPVPTHHSPATAPVVTGNCSEWLQEAGVTDVPNALILIGMESGCDPGIWNRSGSGACGIPQALPCYKLPGFPNDPVAQLEWMQNYVISNYGSWANAVAFHLAHGYY